MRSRRAAESRSPPGRLRRSQSERCCSISESSSDESDHRAPSGKRARSCKGPCGKRSAPRRHENSSKRAAHSSSFFAAIPSGVTGEALEGRARVFEPASSPVERRALHPLEERDVLACEQELKEERAVVQRLPDFSIGVSEIERDPTELRSGIAKPALIEQIPDLLSLRDTRSRVPSERCAREEPEVAHRERL